MKSKRLLRHVALTLLCLWLPGTALGGEAIPPPDLLPLNQIPVPEPPSLFQYVKNKPAAIRLGKAFFWEMQAGSDGVQACGSCHFQAGADSRLTNTVNPGTRGGDTTFQVRGPNDTLQPADFPFHKRDNPDLQTSQVVRDYNDIVGSQGVTLANFVGIVPGSAVEDGVAVPDPIFQAGGVNMRRVTARQAPSVIDAVFNFNNFWDGRGHFAFNGVNPFGPLDPSAGIWVDASGTLVKQPVAIDFASLASQATGPPLDDTEMSFTGRTFPQLGRKLLSLTPLAKQKVHPGDSVLGPLSRTQLRSDGTLSPEKGLKVSYQQMIEDAFQDTLWNAAGTTPEGYTQTEANFSLFWGLAIQLYEATLVSDQTPFDRFLGGDRSALTSQQQDGFNLFFGNARCSICHLGTELTSASVRSAAFVTNAGHALIEPMTVATGQQIIYDNGFNNTGVTPTALDIARGGVAPFTNPGTGLPFPLSFSALAELQALGKLGFNSVLFPQGTLATPILPAQIPASFPVSNNGNFKVPPLRNVELTPPYFHNGSVMTLDDVVDFYARGGNFPAVNAAQLDPDIIPLGTLQGDPVKKGALVAFLKSLTDERVRNHAAPFDHPEIFVPNGDPGFISIAARDADGRAAPVVGVTLAPVTTPTALATQQIGGTVDEGAAVTVTVDTAATVGPVTVAGTSWSAQLSGLAKGKNTVTVVASNLAGDSATLQGSITFLSPPLLTIDPVPALSASSGVTLTGSVEAGVKPVVVVGSSAVAGPVTVGAGGKWSCTLSGLAVGANPITVIAVDAVGTLTVRTASISYVPSDGDFSLDGTVGIGDALSTLRVAVGLEQPSAEQKLHVDVAPLVNGVPAPDGKVDISDALLILKKVVGTIAF